MDYARYLTTGGVTKQIKDREAAEGGAVAALYSNTGRYAVGDYCVHEGKFYVCSTAITANEEFTAAHWTAANLADKVQTVEGDVSSLKSAVTNNTYPFDLSGLTQYNFIISPSSGKWATNTKYASWIVKRPVKAKLIAITGGTNGSAIAMLTSDAHVADSYPSYATGWTGRVTIASGETALFSIPDNCQFIWVNKSTSESNDYTPAYIGFGGDEFDNDYIRIEYAESSGSQYINTGVKLNQDSRIKIRANTTDVTGTSYIFGGRTNTSTNAFGVGQVVSGRVFAGYGAYEYIEFYPSVNVHEYDFNGANLYADGALINTFDAATFTTPNNAYLFATSGSSSNVFYGKCRIYYCQIFDGNGNLLRDFIPVIRRSDSAVMMYDRVNKIAYAANGGTLTGGPMLSTEDNLSSITSNTTRISQIEARLNETNDREYIQTEADRVAKKVHDVQTGKTLTFVACSDLHYAVAVGDSDGVTVADDQRALRDMADGILAVANQTHFDFYACLGDVIYQWQSHGANYNNGVAEMVAVTKLLGDAFGNNQQIRMVGNHDPNCENSDGKEFGADLLNSFTGIYSDMLTRDENAPYGGYGYHDFERQKVRLIVLNTSFYTPETDLTNGTTRYYIGADQAYWLCQALDLSEKEDADEWQIVIGSHVAMDGSTNKDIFRYTAVLNAYVSGGTWSQSSLSYNFSGKNAAKIAMYINGHTHAYRVRNLSYKDPDGNVLGILPIANLFVPNALPGREKVSTDGETYSKTAGTAESTSFQVITIDFDSKVVYAHHYGAGIDIIIHYAPTAEASYTTDLTDPAWASVDTTIATVSSGAVTPVAAGYVMIYAKSETDNTIEFWNYQSVV